MKSTTSINLNLQLPNYSVAVYAVQGDTMSREIEADLFDGQTPFTPPAGALGTVRYYKPDGTSGFYDTLEDEETVAVTWDDNVATIRLAEQTVTVPGEVLVQLSFYSADAERLSAFTFRLFVEKNPYSDQEFESTDYYSVLTARIAAVLGAVAYPPTINAQGHWMLFNTETQQYYDSGVNATGPQGPQGIQGPQGVSVVSVTKKSGTGSAGTTDVYNVNLSNETVAGTFNVYNGNDGQGSPGSATPLMDGTPSAGSANAYAREDHVHPKDTSKLDASAFVLSSATPQMDGTGAAGTSTQVARADHVHPSDSTKMDATSLATEIPEMDGTGAVGTSAKVAREDHVHPSDTTKQDVLSTSTDNVTDSWTGIGTIYIKLAKFGNVVVATVRINTNVATATGSYSKSNVIPSSYRPNSIFTDGASGMISRENSGTQGTGTFKINSDGSVTYGVNEIGVSGVVMMATIAYLT